MTATKPKYANRTAKRGRHEAPASPGRRAASPANDGHESSALDQLYSRPAFMIRRAHQIATAVFTDACSELGLTPSQFSVLFVLRHVGPLSQNELGRLVSLDRSTTALVVKLLVARKLVSVAPHANDRRKSRLTLTNDGRLQLSSAERLTTRASRSLLSVFDPDEAETFLALLERLTTAFGVPDPGARPAKD